MAEGKKTKATAENIQPQNDSVGEMLRVARVKKNLSVEEVSVAIRIRASQLRVIEENNIAALPGMTYAIGFVRSYANYLGLDGIDVVQKFKAEHSQEPHHAKLEFPEPVVESRMPDPLMIGVGAFLAIVVLIGWTIYSNSHSGKAAEQLAAPPAAESAAQTAESLLTPSKDVAASPPETAEATPAAAPAAEAVKTDAAAAPAPAAETPKTEAAATVAATETPPVAEKPAEVAPPVEAKPATKGRITLQATQDTWVQVTDRGGKSLIKKVLKSGEKFVVPDQTGLSLATANAGGVDVYVDGSKAPSLGRSGQILRGVALDPSGLKRKRVQMND